MIFSELYSAYYHTVAEIIKAAIKHPIQTEELYDIVQKHAFGESMLHIPLAISEERWQMIKQDGTTPFKTAPYMPLTTLEKRWIKSILMDSRIHLFCDCDFPEIEPLFLPEDISIFDKYIDGDDYTNETYIQNFRLILDAVKKKYPLYITLKNRKGNTIHKVILPEHLEYSEKDDKFRLIGYENTMINTINIGRIIHCEKYHKPMEHSVKKNVPKQQKVVFELVDKRKSLERVLFHFAHFEKEVEKMEQNLYRVTIVYNKEDETELMIRILSFGPMIQVVAPLHFVEKIKQRLLRQKKL